jgi:acetyl-CoA carboxylase biotin carboxyl carrier protein
VSQAQAAHLSSRSRASIHPARTTRGGLRLFALFGVRTNGAGRLGANGETKLSEQGTPPPADEHREEPKGASGERRSGGRDSRRRRHSPPPQGKRPPEPLINLEELRDLVELISSNGFTDFELEREGIKIRLRREVPGQGFHQADAIPHAQTSVGSQSGAPMATGGPTASSTGLPPAAPHPGAMAEAAASGDEDLKIITSPIVGTFYRSPSPNAASFVSLGSEVQADTVVCIIEAMKLMNEIQAETSGEIAKIYVENGQPVEYGQPLFGIRR